MSGKIKAERLRALLAVVLLGLLLSQYSIGDEPVLFLEKEYYSLGEDVTFTMAEQYLGSVTIYVIGPEKRYKYSGDEAIAEFYPQEKGKYQILVRDRGTGRELQTIHFQVEPPLIETDNTEYVLGGEVILNLNLDTPHEYLLEILYNDKVLKYKGELKKQIIFEPPEEGSYEARIRDTTSSEDHSAHFTVLQPELSPADTSMTTPAPEPQQAPAHLSDTPTSEEGPGQISPGINLPKLDNSSLPWRPSCNYSSNSLGKWRAYFNQKQATEICFYNSSVLYVKVNVSKDILTGEFFKRSTADITITGLDTTLLNPEQWNLTFKIYRPWFEDNASVCPSQSTKIKEMIFISDKGEETFGPSGDFDSYFYVFSQDEKKCGQWTTISIPYASLNDTYKIFPSAVIETVAFELSNVYITNIRGTHVSGSEVTLWPR